MASFGDTDQEVRDQLSISGRMTHGNPQLEVKAIENLELHDKYRDPSIASLDPFDKLAKFHKIAPPMAKYVATAPLANLMRFAGTGLEMALESADFWLLFSFHVLLSAAYWKLGFPTAGGVPEAPGWPKIGTNLIATPGALTAFVIVFYLNQAFSRYLQVSAHCGQALGAPGEYILLLRTHFADHSFENSGFIRRYLCKLVNAANVLAVSMHPNYRPEGIDQWGWFCVLENELLEPAQVEELKQLAYFGDGRLAFREILLWANRGLWAQQSRGFLDAGVASLFTSKLWEVRGHLENLYAMPSGPVPFAYYHLINFIVLTYLIVLSYAFVFVSPLWSIPGFFLILVGLLGVRELSNAMSNPLGHDKTDLPVFDGVHGFLKQSTLLVNRPSGYGGEIDIVKPIGKTD